MKRKQLFFSMLIICCTCLPIISFSQITNDPPPPPPDPIDTSVPFDGGLSILIATGVLYGIKKVKEQKKKEREHNNL
jgi:hypothetical protein